VQILIGTNIIIRDEGSKKGKKNFALLEGFGKGEKYFILFYFIIKKKV